MAAATMLHLFVAGMPAAQQEFIIGVRPDVNQLGQPVHDILIEALARCGAAATRRYNKVLVGAAATLTPEQLTCISSEVDLMIEPDGEVTASATITSWSINRLDGSLADNIFPPPPPQSAGFPVYVLDTGVDSNHPYLNGRVAPVYNDVFGGTARDVHGHGTHCSGTVSGSSVTDLTVPNSGSTGVSQATIIAVKVLDDKGSGSYAGVIEGVDWAVADCLARYGASGRCVGSMSLGGGKSSSLNAAIQSAAEQGLLFAVAAGNSAANACNYSPASAPAAITVGATTRDDKHASYSNFG
jgi:hypothetical protein